MCPGWVMRDLVRHTGEVHRWATGIVGDARLEAWNAGPDEIVGEWPNDEGLVEWFRAGVMQLDQALSAAPDDLECWTFMSASSPKAFWARRQAHELAIHPADSEIPSGAPTIFESSFAADGLHELLVASLTRRGGPKCSARCRSSLSIRTTGGSAPSVLMHSRRPPGLIPTVPIARPAHPPATSICFSETGSTESRSASRETFVCSRCGVILLESDLARGAVGAVWYQRARTSD